MSFNVLSPIEFYRATFEANKLGELIPDDPPAFEKFAEAYDTSPEIIALAQRFVEQMVLDGIPTKLAGLDIRQTAVDMAKAYAAQTALEEACIADFTQKLSAAMLDAAKKFAEASGVDISADELVKIAGLEVTSEQEKRASIPIYQRNIDPLPAGLTAHSGISPQADIHLRYDPENLLKVHQHLYRQLTGTDHASVGLATSAYPDAGKHIEDISKALAPGETDPATRQRFINAVHRGLEDYHASAARGAQPAPLHPILENARQSVYGASSSAPGKMPGWAGPAAGIAGLAGLGLGGMYLLHSTRERDRAERQARARRFEV